VKVKYWCRLVLLLLHRVVAGGVGEVSEAHRTGSNPTPGRARKVELTQLWQLRQGTGSAVVPPVGTAAPYVVLERRSVRTPIGTPATRTSDAFPVIKNYRTCW
jgi:hypothetical protein